MDMWMIWLIAGAVMMVAETIIPGGIIVFLGAAAMIVGGAIYFEWITSIQMALLTWFICSIIFILFLRALFMKYFEGDSKVQNVNEDSDIQGSIVEVVEEILSYKEGRVRFRDTTWMARSDEDLPVGSKAIVAERDGNFLVVKSL